MTTLVHLLRWGSIRAKLIAIGMVTTGASLLLAGSALAVFEYVSYRALIAKEVASTAEIVAANSTAALAFDDAAAAAEILAALAPVRDVVAACLYDERGNLFASYRRAGGRGSCPPAPEADGQVFRGRLLVHGAAVELRGQRIGALRVEATLDALAQRLRLFALVLAAVIGGSSAVAFLVALWLQRIVSTPLLDLAGTARRITDRQDYSLRAPRHGDDELGVAIAAFNQMLDHVEDADRALREAGEQSRAQAQLLRSVLDNMGEGIVALGPDREVLVWNPAAVRLFGPPLRVDPADVPRHYGLHQPDGKTLLAPEDVPINRAMQAGVFSSREILVKPAPGAPDKWVSASASPVRDESGRLVGAISVLRDVTQQKQAEAELRTSEAQLRQAQKMEAIGRLVGGIAHDFNNLLTALLGNTALALESLTPDHPARADLEEVRRAGERAATLTRQLLAFGRKQVLAPQPVDLNEVIDGMETMLRRLIGEHIELVTARAPDLGQVKVDPGQISQVILNLVVNARDAMPEGGRIEIETANVELDEPAGRALMGLRPGRYVRLTVKDSGMGMDAETQSHVFEPFFTTKGPGQGTGLGLATVHGIVRQSGGDVSVSSEPGGGACFTVHLPWCEERAPVGRPPASLPIPRGSETVLLVEDNAPVRGLACSALGRLGYTVLAAADADEALRVFDGHPGPVHLLVTDVLMPRVSGPELANRLAARAPGLRVLFMSGYTAGALGSRALTAGSALLEKPFVPADLARKVREVLDAPQPAGQPA